MRKAIWFLAAAVSAAALDGGGQASETITYKYDALGRLVETKSTGDVNHNVTMGTSYDPAGNRTNYNVTGSSGSASLFDPGAGVAWAWNGPSRDGGGRVFGARTRPAFLRSRWGGTEALPLSLMSLGEAPLGDPAAPEASPF